MEALSGIFISLVTAIHSILPQANLPQVLGINATSEIAAVEVQTRNNELVKERIASNAATLLRSEALEKAMQRREEALIKTRERLQEASREAALKRLELQNKLSKLKDERKKNIVENIDKRLAALNEKWVEQWNNVLTRLTQILAKIETRADKMAISEKDPTIVRNAISTARTAIANAQTAVNNQASQTYVITITSESNLRNDVALVTSKFKADVQKTFDAVKTARRSVAEALTSLETLVGNDWEGTRSGELSQ